MKVYSKTTILATMLGICGVMASSCDTSEKSIKDKAQTTLNQAKTEYDVWNAKVQNDSILYENTKADSSIYKQNYYTLANLERSYYNLPAVSSLKPENSLNYTQEEFDLNFNRKLNSDDKRAISLRNDVCVAQEKALDATGVNLEKSRTERANAFLTYKAAKDAYDRINAAIDNGDVDGLSELEAKIPELSKEQFGSLNFDVLNDTVNKILEQKKMQNANDPKNNERKDSVFAEYKKLKNNI